jgi:hypothetical protein
MGDSKVLEAGKAGIHEIEGSVHQESVQPVTTNVAKAVEYADKDVARHAEETQGIQTDAATNKKLFWKVNKHILVVMLGTYFCQSLDKGMLGFSSIMEVQKDVHFVG